MKDKVQRVTSSQLPLLKGQLARIGSSLRQMHSSLQNQRNKARADQLQEKNKAA